MTEAPSEPSDVTRDALIEGVKLDVRNSMRSDARVWHEALEAALGKVLPEFWNAAVRAAGAVVEEPVWEYGIRNVVSHDVSKKASLQEADEDAGWVAQLGGSYREVVRRRTAGPWEAVEQEGDNRG